MAVAPSNRNNNVILPSLPGILSLMFKSTWNPFIALTY